MRSGFRHSGIAAIVLAALAAHLARAADLTLLDAVRQGDRERVRTLLAQHADANARLADGSTALAWAVSRGDMEMVDALIGAGADVNAANEYGVSPLSIACENGAGEIVLRLLQAGANANAAQWTGETALMTCSRSGNLAGVKALIAQGADVNAREQRKGQSALMWAAAQGHADVIRELIQKGADVNAHSKKIELVAPLRATTYTKDVKFPQATGDSTPLMFAARSGSIDAVRALLDAGAKINDKTEADGIGEGPALVVAAASGYEDLSILLLDRGADPNAADGYGLTALHWALMEGLRALVGGGQTPTERFWFHPNMPKLVKALLVKGADPNAKITADFPPYDNTLFGHTLGNNLPQISLVGTTPFLLASACGDVATMRVLVEGRADPKITTVDGTSPLMVAAGVGRERGPLTPEQQKNYLEAVKLGVLLGNDVNAANREGRTALHAATYLGAADVIEFLASKGANLEAQDIYGQTAMTIALGDPGGLVYRQLPGDAYDYRFRQPKEQKKIAELLLKLGAQPYTGKYRDRSGE